MLLFTGSARAEVVFFDALSDVPVAKGLQVLPEQDLVFSKPEGRIVEVVSAIEPSTNEAIIRDFYQQTLPAFGWNVLASGDYSRGDELLKFWFERNDGQVFLHLRVEPADQ